MADDPALATLLARAALGDRAAFRKFYDTTAPQLYALGLRMVRDRARAEDLLQDVYLRAWYRAGDYHPGKGEPLAWLVAIARNRAIDAARSAQRRNVSLDAVPEVEDESTLDDSGTRTGEHGARLHYCIDRLDAAQRQSIFCAFFHGLSHSEIARRFSEPVGTIKTRIRRGLMSLRECLES